LQESYFRIHKNAEIWTILKVVREPRIDQRFAEVERRFAEVDRRLDQIDAHLERLEHRFDTLQNLIFAGAVTVIAALLATQFA
jgi:hypothetical protein